MLVGPIPLGIVGVDDIVCGREAPATRAIHQEGDVLGVVVLVTDKDIEQRAAHLLLDRFASETEHADGLDCLLVAIGTGEVEIEMAHRAKRLHVELLAVRRAIKALGHEMRPPAFLVQS